MGKNLLSRSSRKKNKGGSEPSASSGGNSSTTSLRRSRSEESSVSESLAGALHNREELEDVFKRFDANGDGKISSSELGEILRSMGGRVGSQELGLMMKEADADGDGFISLEEFIDLNTKGNDRATCLEDLKNAFQVFDLDRNGSISADELYQVLKGMGDGSTREDCKNMITGVAINMPPAGAPRSNPIARQEPYAYGYPADPYYVVLPPAPQLHVRRRRRLRLVAYAAALVICLGLLLGGSFYFFWPSQPEIQVSHTQFNDMNFQTIPNPGSDVPYLFMNTSMDMFLQIKNTDFFNVWYDSVNVGLGYRGQMIGVFESEGGRLAARQTVYVNSTLELYGTEVSNDVGNFLEDLARKELPLDTVAEFNGGIRLLYAKFSLKKAVSCEVVVNPDNQTILSQDCGLVI